MNLTSAAIEAAAKVLKYEDENPGHNYPQIARLALEAAAPYIYRDIHTQRTEWPDIPRASGARQA